LDADDDPADDERSERARSFLRMHPRWHWAAGFHLWDSRRALREGEYKRAGDILRLAIAQLRRDGNWETLWRALVLEGELYHRIADYEPSLRALDEAARILRVIAATIDDESGRTAYLSAPLSTRLEQTRGHIYAMIG
jgi:hypothetical protein